MTDATSKIYPTFGIRVWIGLGIIGCLTMLSLPFFLQREVSQERQRFEACAKRERLDCATSVIWALLEWDKKPLPNNP